MGRTHTDGQTGAVWRFITVEEVRGYLSMYAAIKEGYEEARRGLPLIPEAFAADFGQAIRYEEGRRMVRLLKMHGIKPPAWHERGKPPSALIVALADNVRRGGGL